MSLWEILIERVNMFNILICDDEKDIVSALKIYLSVENYNIFTAYNGKEALNIIEENEIHLVLLDIMMPVMDGIETLSKIREKKVTLDGKEISLTPTEFKIYYSFFRYYRMAYNIFYAYISIRQDR